MKYIVGIDLGTTNCSVSYAKKSEKGTPIKVFSLTEGKDLLPSLIYLAQGHEVSSTEGPKHYVTGIKAQALGRQIPSRLVHSAKSWLGLSHVGQNDAILPVSSDPSVQKISPIEALKRLIEHIRRSWNLAHPESLLENQFVVLTVPASFDEKARRQILEAVQKGGIKQFTFLEEPQSAFYHLMNSHEGLFQEGNTILVCDIGGGTTDFSLIDVRKGREGLLFERVLVGEHLLIGGDNIDYAIAHKLKERMGGDLKEDMWLELLQEARRAKEEVFLEKEIVLFGASSSLMRSMQKVTLYRKDIEECLSAFFHFLPWEEALSVPKKRGMRSFGLPFDSEPNILLHLARFLSSSEKKVSHVLFNGGQTIDPLIQEKVISAIEAWFPHQRVVALPLQEPEHAVSKGAAAFGLAHLKIKGQKVKSGISRSYFLEVETEGEEKSGILVIPAGLEFGETVTIDPLFLLKTCRPVLFNLYASSQKNTYKVGEVISLTPEEFSKQGQLHGEVRTKEGSLKIPIFLEAYLSEIGILEIRAIAKETGQIYTFEFSLENRETKRFIKEEATDYETVASMQKMLKETLNLKMMESCIAKERTLWSVSLIRELFDTLIEMGIPKESTKFWNCLGFLLRPGTGHILDSERISKVWKIILKEGFQEELQMWIALRRIAPGLTKGQQQHIKNPLFKRLWEKNPGRIEPKGREEQYLSEEIVRTLSSLELIEIKDKVKLGNALLESIEKGNVRDAYLWALGRLGARVPLFATASSLISKDTVEKWLQRLLALKGKDTLEWKNLFLQLARKTPAAHLSISESIQDQVRARFGEFDESLLNETQGLEELIGDSLPLGITLHR